MDTFNDKSCVDSIIESYLKRNKTIIENIIKTYNSPCYVYLDNIIKYKYKIFIEAFEQLSHKNRKLYYACKANTNSTILKILKDLGVAGIDCVSLGEVYIAQKVGFKEDQILYTGNNNSLKELKEVYDKNILINFNEVEALEQFCKTFNLANFEICVRIDYGVGLGSHDYVKTAGIFNKFGVKIHELPKLFEVMIKFNLSLVGLHQHSGSNIKDQIDYYNMVKRTVDNLKHIIALYEKCYNINHLKDLKFINFGGGFGVQYTTKEQNLEITNLFKDLDSLLTSNKEKINDNVTIIFEPGRYLTAECGLLITEVTSIRKFDKDNVFLGCNTGINHLIRPALYGSFHNIINLTKNYNFFSNKVDNNIQCSNGIMEKEKNTDIVSISIYGNICESSDFFIKDFLVKKEEFTIDMGDLLVILNCGAYGYSMASTYNSRLLPAEVLIKSDKDYLIRKRQSYEDLIGLNIFT